MKATEKAAKAKLASKHGMVTHKGGTEAGSIHDDNAPTVVLKHGIIARMTGKPPRRG